MDIRKMICVGVGSRSFDGGIGSYNLVEYGDPERNVKNYSVEYILAAIKRREMAVANLKINETGTGLVYVTQQPKVQTKVLSEDEDEDETKNKITKKKTTRKRKYKSSSKHKKKR